MCKKKKRKKNKKKKRKKTVDAKSQRWIELFGKEEWEWITKLGGAIRDREEKRAFWEGIRAKKEADPSYSIFTDFPKAEKEVRKEKTEKERAREEFAKWCEARWGKRGSG